MTKHSLFLLAACVLLPAAAATTAATAQDSPRPNIILIMADDLGYETIAANGGTSYRTPVLDRLAATGARFEQCYVQPLCTPTRVQLMTGAYNVRNYITFGEMDPGLTTFGNLFRQAGYATAITGKWQLGRDPQMPHRFGFDEHCLWQHTRRPPRYANPGLEINGVERDHSNGEYGPDLVNSFALDFITRHRDQPFFLYYPMILTHDPYQPTPDSADWDPRAIGEQVHRRPAHFGDMVEYMDKLIGRVVTRLDELKLRDSTLLIFVGDNGTGRGATSMFAGRQVTGGKGTTTAAGMHVPLIVNWPGTIPERQVSATLIDSTDFLPTICAAANIPLPDTLTVDGRSFLPQLKGEPGIPREWIYCWYSPRGEPLREFAFDQNFKLYRTGEFFDLTADRSETTPLSVSELTGNAARTATRLQQALDRYRDARPAGLPQRTPAGAGQTGGQKKAAGQRKKKAAAPSN